MSGRCMLNEKKTLYNLVDQTPTRQPPPLPLATGVLTVLNIFLNQFAKRFQIVHPIPLRCVQTEPLTGVF